MKLVLVLTATVGVLAGVDAIAAQQTSRTEPAAAGWSLASAPELVIGTGSRGEADELHRVASAVRLADGSIVVANGGTNQLRFYDARGRHVRSVGRTGDGPGEFQRLGTTWRIRGDTLLVHDFRTHRISVFTPAGALVRTSNFAMRAPDGRVAGIEGAFSDGTLLTSLRTLPAFGRYDKVVRDTIEYLRATPEGRRLASFGTYIGGESFIKAEGGGMTVLDLTFSAATRLHAAGSRVIIADQQQFSYSMRDFAGAPAAAVQPQRRFSGPAPALRQLHEDWAAQDDGGEPMRRIRTDAIRALNTRAPVPAFDSVVQDSEGLIWFEEFQVTRERPRRWLVTRSTGAVVAELTLPARFRVHEIGRDYILGAAIDSLGVETVLLYRLTRGAA